MIMSWKRLPSVSCQCMSVSCQGGLPLTWNNCGSNLIFTVAFYSEQTRNTTLISDVGYAYKTFVFATGFLLCPTDVSQKHIVAASVMVLNDSPKLIKIWVVIAEYCIGFTDQSEVQCLSVSMMVNSQHSSHHSLYRRRYSAALFPLWLNMMCSVYLLI